jgi:hypothetical protein
MSVVAVGDKIILSGQDHETEHPADIANVALQRVATILASVSACFDDRRGNYAVDVPYVAYSVQAASTLVAEATAALDDLYNVCDLTIVGDAVEAQSVDSSAPEEGDLDFTSLLSSRESDTKVLNDAPATTYEELLQKVTAAEVFAQSQANQIDGGENSMLIPILNSLKQDLLRMKRVA